MKRHAKTLQTKAKKNQVVLASDDTFLVTSATSGKQYRVTPLANGGYQCVCRWSLYNSTSDRPCSHCLSVIEWIEQTGHRSTSVWASPEDAKRQHRTTEQVGLGLWMTTRKSANV